MALYRRNRHKRVVLGALAILSPFLFLTGCGQDPPEQPNVLVVVIEGLRGDRVTAAGYDKPTTPTLDRLAEEGVLYENAIAATPMRLASHASILTSRYPAEHGVGYDTPVLDESLDTLAERLRNSGYATVAVSSDPDIVRASGFDQGFDSFLGVAEEGVEYPDEGTAAVEGRLLEWIQKRDRSVPFFAYVVLRNPTLPFAPPSEFRTRFLPEGADEGHVERLTSLWVPFARQYSLGTAQLAPSDFDLLRGLYDGEVAYADYRVGRIVSALEDEDLLDDTFFIVTSDSGEDLGEHGLLADSSNLYDTMIRVPLIARLPEVIAAGARITDQVQTVELADSILRIVESEGRDPARLFMPGRLLVVSQASHDPSTIRYVSSLFPRTDFSIFARDMVGVRTPEYKYVVTTRETAALFDLKSDPAEQASIYGMYLEKAQEMDDYLASWVAGLRPAPGSGNQADGEPEKPGETGEPPGDQ